MGLAVHSLLNTENAALGNVSEWGRRNPLPPNLYSIFVQCDLLSATLLTASAEWVGLNDRFLQHSEVLG